MEQSTPNRCWYLEGFVNEEKVLRRIRIHPVPFQIGRSAELELSIQMANISRQHAEFFVENDKLMVRDLGSRNGTFVNQEKIEGAQELKEGDIVHLGTCEFRIGCEDQEADCHSLDTMPFEGLLPSHFEPGVREFLAMLETQAVTSFFQPIVTMADRKLIGYESLGRGLAEGLSPMPLELFQLAQSVGMESTLSRLFRDKALEESARMAPDALLFINIHPAEMRQPDSLLESFRQVRQQYPKVSLVVEIPESFVTDPAAIKKLRGALGDLSIQCAYDDFGAGQARLLELAEIPPDYLKFDMCLVHELHQAREQKQQMVQLLVKYATEAGVKCLAEGVETAQEAEICCKMGFHYAQGFFYGRPVPLAR